MKTIRRVFGKTKTVAMKNCRKETASIDLRMSQREAHALELTTLTAKKAFEYTQGGKGDRRIRIISGSPFLSLQNTLETVHEIWRAAHYDRF